MAAFIQLRLSMLTSKLKFTKLQVIIGS